LSYLFYFYLFRILFLICVLFQKSKEVPKISNHHHLIINLEHSILVHIITNFVWKQRPKNSTQKNQVILISTLTHSP
jgi:hypothetical protein